DTRRTGRSPERAADLTGDWPAEVTAKRLERERERSLGCRSAVAQGGLQVLLHGLQLAGELRVQIAAAVDVAHQIALRLRGALGGSAPARRGGRPPALSGPRHGATRLRAGASRASCASP